MNIASWFSAYRLLAADLEREREAHADTKRKAEEKEQKLIDALARAAGKPAVFERPAPPKASTVPPVAFGPTMSAGRQAAKQQEAEAIIKKAEAAAASNNGNHPALPVIPDSE